MFRADNDAEIANYLSKLSVLSASLWFKSHWKIERHAAKASRGKRPGLG